MSANVTLKSIAEIIGVSKTVVSWVLSGQGDKRNISIEMQKKVLKCADDLAYKPNYLARCLNVGSTGTLGLVLPSISDSFYSSIADSITARAEVKGYTILIGNSESDINRELRLVKEFRNRRVDGIILATMKLSDVEIRNMKKEGFPFILFDRFYPELDTNYVIIDNEDATYQLTRHLLSKGFKRIALLTTNSYLTSMNLRYKGYQKALKEAGIELDPILIGDLNIENYRDDIVVALNKMFETGEGIDAFVFTTHILALEAFNYFNLHGIDIKKGDILASIHSDPSYRTLSPQISYAQMPMREFATLSVDILVEQIASIKAHLYFVNRQEMLDCEMVLK